MKLQLVLMGTYLTDCLVRKAFCENVVNSMQIQCLFHFRERTYEDVQERGQDEQAFAEPVLLREGHYQVVLSISPTKTVELAVNVNVFGGRKSYKPAGRPFTSAIRCLDHVLMGRPSSIACSFFPRRQSSTAASMSKHTFRYADAPSTSSQVSYSLVALPAALARAVNERDSGGGVLASLTIKGQPTDEAVLCTKDTTYNLRAVQSSNSILICEASTSAAGAAAAGTTTRSNGKGKEVEIKTTLHQTLELDLAIPKLERISELLRGQEWSPEEEEEDNVRQVKVGLPDYQQGVGERSMLMPASISPAPQSTQIYTRGYS